MKIAMIRLQPRFQKSTIIGIMVWENKWNIYTSSNYSEWLEAEIDSNNDFSRNEYEFIRHNREIKVQIVDGTVRIEGVESATKQEVERYKQFLRE
jgi:hypothetical protein